MQPMDSWSIDSVVPQGLIRIVFCELLDVRATRVDQRSIFVTALAYAWNNIGLRWQQADVTLHPLLHFSQCARKTMGAQDVPPIMLLAT